MLWTYSIRKTIRTKERPAMVNEDCKCKNCGCGTMSMDEMISMIDDQTLPFTETIISENIIIREFQPNQPNHLFKWHFDEQDRIINAIEDNDWKFQYDNKIPIPLKGYIKIEAGVYHRIIPGKTPLKLQIKLT